MIKVFFPPGCYGTFLTKCLYKLTTLNQTKDYNFVFDEFGSSHDYRLSNNRHLIDCGHLETLSVDPSDDLVVIMPCEQHQLDYFDNQFWKNEKKHICNYIHTLYDSNEVQTKLFQAWNYSEQLTDSTPAWILREWCSFWIHDCLNKSYRVQKYQEFAQATYINTQDIFKNLSKVIFMLANKLSLTVSVDESKIEEIQKNFVQNQQLHGIQKKCQAWVIDIIEGKDSISPCQTIFDEAFVQHLLRQHSYEVKCNDLNLYPTNAIDFKKIIYRV
jgi:hypothetical protein